MQRGSEKWNDSNYELFAVAALNVALVYSTGLTGLVSKSYGKSAIKVIQSLLRSDDRSENHLEMTDVMGRVSPLLVSSIICSFGFILFAYIKYALPSMINGFKSDCMVAGVSIIPLELSRALAYTFLILRVKKSFDLSSFDISGTQSWIMMLTVILLFGYGTGTYMDTLLKHGCGKETVGSLRTSVLIDVFLRVAAITALIMKYTEIIKCLQRILEIERRKADKADEDTHLAKVVSTSNTGSLAQLRGNSEGSNANRNKAMSRSSTKKCESGLVLVYLCRSLMILIFCSLLSSLLCHILLGSNHLLPVAYALDVCVFATCIVLSLPISQPVYQLGCGWIENKTTEWMFPVLIEVEQATNGGHLKPSLKNRRHTYEETSISSVTRTITGAEPHPFGSPIN